MNLGQHPPAITHENIAKVPKDYVRRPSIAGAAYTVILRLRSPTIISYTQDLPQVHVLAPHTGSHDN